MRRNDGPLTAAQRARALGLGNRRASERAAAERAIRAMGAEAVPFLVEAVREERAHGRSRTLRAMAGWALVYATAIVGQLWLAWRGAWHSGGTALQLVVVLDCALLTAAPALYALHGRPRRHACALLAGLGDVRAVGPLLDACTGFETAEDRAIAQALIELLPRLRAGDAHLLDRYQYRNLVFDLEQAAKDPSGFPPLRIAFDIAIIRALEQIGDEEAEKAVRNIAALPAYNRDCERLVAAAQAALPALEARAAADRAGRTLLRAASAPAERGGALLRPASGAATADEEQLLRPVVTEDGEG